MDTRGDVSHLDDADTRRPPVFRRPVSGFGGPSSMTPRCIARPRRTSTYFTLQEGALYSFAVHAADTQQ